jgi:hypothetical protein
VYSTAPTNTAIRLTRPAQRNWEGFASPIVSAYFAMSNIFYKIQSGQQASKDQWEGVNLKSVLNGSEAIAAWMRFEGLLKDLQLCKIEHPEKNPRKCHPCLQASSSEIVHQMKLPFAKIRATKK